jgi:hypothetical protein
MLLYSLGVCPERLNRIYRRHDADRGGRLRHTNVAEKVPEWENGQAVRG